MSTTAQFGYCQIRGSWTMKERWRRLLALVFSLLIAVIALAAIIEIGSEGNAHYIGAIAGIAILSVVLVFGIQLDEINITTDGLQVLFSDRDPIHKRDKDKDEK